MGRRPPLRLGEDGGGWKIRLAGGKARATLAPSWHQRKPAPPAPAAGRRADCEERCAEQELGERVSVHLLHPDKIHKLKP